jgi:hypothetical protein
VIDREDYANAGTVDAEDSGLKRLVYVTRAADIQPRPVRWLWEGRLAQGTFNLLGGREGIGKSIVSSTIAADITRGRVPVEDGSRRAAVSQVE